MINNTDSITTQTLHWKSFFLKNQSLKKKKKKKKIKKKKKKKNSNFNFYK